MTLDDEIIDKYVLDLCNVINRAGKSQFVLFGNKNADENKNVQSINNFWYDSECRDKKRIFEIYEKKFRESNLDEDRVNMCNARNKYSFYFTFTFLNWSSLNLRPSKICCMEESAGFGQL